MYRSNITAFYSTWMRQGISFSTRFFSSSLVRVSFFPSTAAYLSKVAISEAIAVERLMTAAAVKLFDKQEDASRLKGNRCQRKGGEVFIYPLVKRWVRVWPLFCNFHPNLQSTPPSDSPPRQNTNWIPWGLMSLPHKLVIFNHCPRAHQCSTRDRQMEVIGQPWPALSLSWSR